MRDWESFEVSMSEYLKGKFSGYASFEHRGGSNAKISDIQVTTKDASYYIEAKCCPAQSGQFVLFPNFETGKFEYSSRNLSPINSHAQTIIEHMNGQFEAFCQAGTRGKYIVFDGCEAVFAEWIVDMYKRKSVRFIITNDGVIVPVDDYLKAFKITGDYRIKKSGSGSVSKCNMKEVVDYLIAEGINAFVEGSRVLVKSERELAKVKFVCKDNEYIFSKRENDYEIRQLSKTFNANVIFYVERKGEYRGLSDEEFIKLI